MGAVDRPVDLAILGGGITGSAVARDASLRGLSAALFEQGDFSSGTTSRSSRLIHGGLRYLEGLHFGLVRESLRERDWIHRRLTHLLRPVPVLIPVYRGDGRGMLRVRAGMFLYGLLARRTALPRPGTVSAAAAIERVPGLRPEGLAGGAVFHDYRIPVPERLVFENLLSAVEAGRKGGGSRVTVRNHATVEGIACSEGIFRLRVRDRRTGNTETVSARVVINATGPWTDRTRRLAPHSPDIAAQVILAAREEWAETPEDVILRRMHLGISEDRGACAVPAVEEILAKERPPISPGPPLRYIPSRS